MRYCVLFWVLIGLNACVGSRNYGGDQGFVAGRREIWRAWRGEGDKPGMGIELKFRGEEVNATCFLMDPADPSNFRCGRALKTETLGFDAKRLSLRVKMPYGEKRLLVIRFDGPFNGDVVAAVWEWTDSFELPLEFRRELEVGP